MIKRFVSADFNAWLGFRAPAHRSDHFWGAYWNTHSTGFHRLGILFAAMLVLFRIAGAQSWLPAPKPPRPFKPGSTALQLTDGTIMVQEYGSANWWQLTPDKNADYVNGTWTQLTSSAAWGADVIEPYAPRFFASAVLPDGRVIVEGGEYEYGSGTTVKQTNKGAIFDPTYGPGGYWTPVFPPTGWNKIGDAPSVVLQDGTFMLGYIFGTRSALLDATKVITGNLSSSKNAWKIVSGKGKCDRNNEEGWTLLPGGNVLTVDAYIGKGYSGAPCSLFNNSEFFIPGAAPVKGIWITAGDTMAPLSDLPCSGGKSGEVGPAILRPDGSVFATGANECKGGGAGHTAVFDTATARWKKTQDIPCTADGGCNDMADAPAGLLVTGNVLVQTSPGSQTGNSTFYEFDLNTNIFNPTPIPLPPGFQQGNSEPGRMLAAASGHLFYMRSGELHVSPASPAMWFYVPKGTYEPSWAPVITDVTDNGTCVGCIDRGATYTVQGTQLNGLSQGAAYGDDAQSASNYPLVLIENCQTGKKTFARTHDFSTMGVATGPFKVVSAQFTVSPTTDEGLSKLVVIANGIPSQPFGGDGCYFNVQPPRR